MKTLRDDQIEDLALLMRDHRFGLFSDPGTGKTPPVCVYLYWLAREKNQKGIWCMPKSLLGKNFQELLEFTEFHPGELCIFDGHNDKPEHQVFLMTFKAFATHWRALLDRHRNINALPVDEIHMPGGFGSDGSQATQQFYAAMNKIERFVPMTGTLINGRLSSAYPTIKVIEPRYYTSLSNFNAIHEIKDEYGKRVGWTNHERLRTIVEAHSVRRTFESVYGPEAKVIVTEVVDMAPQQRAKYDEFEKQAYLELEDRFLDGTLPGVATIRCRQIMGHPENVRLPIQVDDNGKPIAWKSYDLVGKEKTGKDEAISLHLTNHVNTGRPLVIFATLVAEQERIARLVAASGLRCTLINGEVPGHIRTQLDKDFQAGKYDVMIASPATAGVGFNWPHVDHVIFASIDYQDGNFIQAYRRMIRGRRDKSLLITVLLYRNSIDFRIAHIVEQKAYDAHLVDPTRELLKILPRTEGPIIVPDVQEFFAIHANEKRGENFV